MDLTHQRHQMEKDIEIEFLQEKIHALKAELTRINEGIKRGDGCTIIDGGDMYDYGWRTLYEIRKDKERYLKMLL